MSISNLVIDDLKTISSEERARTNAWFFKTCEGEYGYGDVFWGITVPQTRLVVRKYNEIPLEAILELLKHPVHEVRLCAVLLLVQQYPKHPKETYEAYMQYTTWINNWDLVDASCAQIVGAYLEKKSKRVLTKLAKSQNIWERRIAMGSTYYYIKQGKSEEALWIATILINDKHDLIQKAVGWMLREVGKHCSQDIEKKFLDVHASAMPRTMLRYSIEHFSPEEKKYYLNLKQL